MCTQAWVQVIAAKWMRRHPQRLDDGARRAAHARTPSSVSPSPSASKPRPSSHPVTAGNVKKTTNVTQPNQNERGSCWLTRHARRHTLDLVRMLDHGGHGCTPSVIERSSAGRGSSRPSPTSRASSSRRRNRLSSSADQLGAVAVLDDAAVVEHDDLVDVAQRRQPVGDDQRRAARHQLGDGRLDAAPRSRVDARGRLVEHDEVGLAQPHPGQRQQLRLAGRQPGAARAEGAVDAAVDERAEPDVCAARASTAASVGAGSNSVTLSRTVPANSSTSWGISATRRRSSASGMSAIGTPPSRTVPSVGSTSRSSRRENVVLPLPVRPTTPTERPAAMCEVDVDAGSAARRRRRSRTRRRRSRSTSAPGGGRRACHASTIVGLDGEQVDDAHHRAVRLLHRLELLDHVLERARQQQHVLEQQERRAER